MNLLKMYLKIFPTGLLQLENKKDNTPVTIADKKTELKIRDLINKTYPKTWYI